MVTTPRAAPRLRGRWSAASIEAGARRETAATASTVRAAVAAFQAAHPDAGTAEVAVVIPAYNESATVAAVVDSIPAHLCGLATEVIVVDDGSADGTAARAAAAGALVCRLEGNVGQGVALRVGYDLAARRGARYVATTDADGQLDAAELPSLLAPVLAGEADFAAGSRRLGHSDGDDPVRTAGVALFGRLVTLLTGTTITDPANGLRVWRREVSDSVTLRQPQYQTAELLIRAAARGYRIVEVPVTVRSRTSGSTKKGGNLVYGYRFAGVILSTWWSERATARRCRPHRRGLWW